MRSFARDGLVFDLSDDGPADGRAVIALHGFPEDRHCWAPLASWLVPAGYRVLAPDQRGYSPAARPAGRRSYTLDKLSGDILALADAAGVDRFDVLGHDWGAVVAWDLAGRHPERIRSLSALSVPHPRAVADAALRSGQLLRSWYMLAFQLPAVPEAMLRLAGADRAAQGLERDGLDAATARRYAERMGSVAEMTPRINWYRALPLGLGDPLPTVGVPTLYVWGDGDHYLSRFSAERCGRYVEAPYRFHVLPGASHWLPTTAADRVGPLVLEHLAATG